MTGDIALSTSIRANLASLQTTNRLLDRTQLRLATGRDVNSVFDDPVNFVAAQRLNDRASDLDRILDNITQSLRIVEQATNGTAALTTLLEQGQSIVESASTAISSSTASSAIMTGDVDLSLIDDIPNDISSATANSEIRINLINNTTGATLLDATVAPPAANSGQITIDAGDSIQQIVARINDKNDDLIQAGTISEPIIEARLDQNGQFIIQSLVNDSTVNVEFLADSAAPNNDASNLSFATELGFGSLVQIVGDTNANGLNNAEVTLTTASVLQSVALFSDLDGNANNGATLTRTARASDTILSLANAATSGAGTEILSGVANSPELLVGVNGVFAAEFDTINGTATIQEFIDHINNDANVSQLIRAEFDDTTGQLSIRSIDSTASTVQIGVRAEGANASTLRLGFGQQPTLTATANDNDSAVENIRLGSASGELLELEEQFNDLRAQIDQLVADASFRGVNILNGDDLITFFNEDRTSSLTTTGVVFTSTGLNLNQANFGSTISINSFISAVRTAQDNVRGFASGLTNDLNVISTRQTFTESTILTLQTGADDLTLADEEEEGARLLALQTRQSLGITSLSLATQAQQSILRLF